MQRIEWWEPVPDWEGYYEVSSRGRVRSSDRYITTKDGRLCHYRSRIKTPTPNADGYLAVGLSRKSQVKTERVHVLVLRAFIGPCPKGMEGCHKNGNRTDNIPSNLVWQTHYDNIQDKVRQGRQGGLSGEDNPNSVLTWGLLEEIKSVRQKEDLSYTKLAERFNVSVGALFPALKGYTWNKPV